MSLVVVPRLQLAPVSMLLLQVVSVVVVPRGSTPFLETHWASVWTCTTHSARIHECIACMHMREGTRCVSLWCAHALAQEICSRCRGDGLRSVVDDDQLWSRGAPTTRSELERQLWVRGTAGR